MQATNDVFLLGGESRGKERKRKKERKMLTR
jgi:hypothetical protein